MNRRPLSLSTPSRNLIRLTLIRGITWTGFMLLTLLGVELWQMQLHVPQVFGVIILMALINLLTWWRLRKPWPVTETENLCHLLLDVIGLSALFYFTGGSTNPFISYYLVPLTISAATLPWIYTWIIAAATLSAYTFLMLYHQPVAAFAHHAASTHAVFNLHILGMWVNFMLSAGLITYFVFKMANALRQRESMLARTREKALRDEQILAVATQAAGTAHELGTPLSTMAVMLKELINDHADQPELKQDLELLRQQVDTCKETLRELVRNADKTHLEHPSPQAVDRFFQQLLERWQVLRPDVSHQIVIQGEGEPPLLQADATLSQAFLNLLNNAADASPEKIDIQINWEPDALWFQIHDFGRGIPMEIADQLGETFISTKSKGLGIGLFLTHATINRYGGTVSLYNHPQGGTLTEVYLPLDAG